MFLIDMKLFGVFFAYVCVAKKLHKTYIFF
jgi:hypothetical protein